MDVITLFYPFLFLAEEQCVFLDYTRKVVKGLKPVIFPSNNYYKQYYSPMPISQDSYSFMLFTTLRFSYEEIIVADTV